MNLKTYAQKAKRTLPDLSDQYPHMNELHMILGLVTEVGELADVYKRNMAYGAPLDPVGEGEEIADIMWYLVNFCSMRGFDIEKLLKKNIEKLKQRFPERFSEEKAINRNVIQERKILEK